MEIPRHLYLILLLAAPFLFCCKGKSDDGAGRGSPDGSSGRALPDALPTTPVRTITLETSDFQQELVANGKLEAVRKADLRFRMDGQKLIGGKGNSDETVSIFEYVLKER